MATRVDDLNKVPAGYTDPATFDPKTAGKTDPTEASPLARSAALAVINTTGLGQVGLVEGMGDPRLAYTLPAPAMAPQPAPQQQAAAATGDKKATTGTTTESDDSKLYSTKAALLAAMVKAGISGAANLTVNDIDDDDLTAVNAGDDDAQSLAKVAEGIFARKQKETKKDEPAAKEKQPAIDQEVGQGMPLPAVRDDIAVC